MVEYQAHIFPGKGEQGSARGLDPKQGCGKEEPSGQWEGFGAAQSSAVHQLKPIAGNVSEQMRKEGKRASTLQALIAYYYYYYYCC